MIICKGRLQLWEVGKINSLLLEVGIIQQVLTSNNNQRNIDNISKRFVKVDEKGKHQRDTDIVNKYYEKRYPFIKQNDT